jgi:hypothetical protein
MLTSEFENMAARVAPLTTLPSRQVLMVQMLLQIRHSAIREISLTCQIRAKFFGIHRVASAPSRGTALSLNLRLTFRKYVSNVRLYPMRKRETKRNIGL